MSNQRDKPSIQARRVGYAVLGRILTVLSLLFYKDDENWYTPDHCDGTEWRDFMIRHTPPPKLGGPSKPIGKRRKAKRKDRRSTTL